MADYTQTNFFGPNGRVGLPADPLDRVRTARLDEEFAAIEAAIATKEDAGGGGGGGGLTHPQVMARTSFGGF